jgi:hypothetical protein
MSGCIARHLRSGSIPVDMGNQHFNLDEIDVGDVTFELV